MYHAMVVDDDAAFLRFMTFCLAKGNYRVTPVSSATALLKHLEHEHPDLMLLDRVLPDVDGLLLCERLKARYPLVPILMFSVKGTHDEVIKGLRIGADDYLPKPFSLQMLLAKVDALCRRFAPQEKSNSRLVVGALELFEAGHEVYLDGQALPLTKTEFTILSLLMKEPGVVFPRHRIAAAILGYSCEKPQENNIAFHINGLRKKLGAYRAFIKTVRGVGYKFSE